jgi:hypothetical protein
MLQQVQTKLANTTFLSEYYLYSPECGGLMSIAISTNNTEMKLC